MSVVVEVKVGVLVVIPGVAEKVVPVPMAPATAIAGEEGPITIPTPLLKHPERLIPPTTPLVVLMAPPPPVVHFQTPTYPHHHNPSPPLPPPLNHPILTTTLHPPLPALDHTCNP